LTAAQELSEHGRDLASVRTDDKGGGVAKYAFLSDEWIAEAKRIREEYRGRSTGPGQAIRMNQIVTEVPFGEGTVKAHMDTSSGEMELETGHIDGADLTVTLDYATAKAVLVDGNPQAGMQAFMAGKIKVDGDMTKLLALQAMPADPTASEIARRIQEITE
jgi:putative sterol carrier protein